MDLVVARSLPSSWDDNRLRSYLEEKGVIKTKQQATRDELLAKMNEAYAKTTNPIWQAWSDSYIVSLSSSHGGSDFDSCTA
jgi:hypothetical protein